MEERDKLIILYDYYKDLLSENKKEYFEEYYFNNLSLAEVSEKYNISRNAVHKQLKVIEEKLLFFEKKLKLKEKYEKLENIINKIDDVDIKKKLQEIIES